MAGDVIAPDALEARMRKRWTSLGFSHGTLKLRKRSSGWSSQARRQVEDTTPSETSQGFSRIEFEALIGNTETDGPENVENTLGLDIMSNDIGTLKFEAYLRSGRTMLTQYRQLITPISRSAHHLAALRYSLIPARQTPGCLLKSVRLAVIMPG